MDKSQDQFQFEKSKLKFVNQSSIFDWQELTSLPVGMEHVQAVWFDDQLCVGGGLAQGSNRNSASLYMYTPSTDWNESSWQKVEAPTSSYALACYHSQLLLIGGYEYPSFTPTNKIFSLKKQNFFQTIPPMQTERISPSAVSKNQYLIVAGGKDASSLLSSVEIFDSESWFSTFSLPKACHRMQSITRGNDWYLSGGLGQGKEMYCVSIQSLIFGKGLSDHLSTWKVLPDVPLKHSSTSFINNQLLTVGGQELAGGCKSTILARGGKSWIEVGELPVALGNTCSIVLPSGEILVIGGTLNNKSSSSYVFKAMVRVDLRPESVDKPPAHLLAEKNELAESDSKWLPSFTRSTTLKSRQVSTGSDVSETEVVSKEINIVDVSSEDLSSKDSMSPRAIVSDFSIPGVDVLEQTSIVITNAKQSFSWEGYGFKLNVPKNSLPHDVDQCILHVIASLAGEYEFPQKCELISGVFWMRCEPYCCFRKKLTLEVQHCAKKGSSKKLEYVRALCSQKSLPYTFKSIKPGQSCCFTDFSSYGSIQLDQFSGLAIVGRGGVQRIYNASLYYIGRDPHSKKIHFVVSWDDEIHLKAIRKFYKKRGAEEGCDVDIEFDEQEKISLDIPTDGIVVESWKVTPLFPPVISRSRVDYYSPGRRIPSCQLKAKYVGQEAGNTPIPELLYAVSLIGVKGFNNMITIDIDPSTTHMSESKLQGWDHSDSHVKSSLTYNELIMHIGIHDNMLDAPCSDEHLKYISSRLSDWLKYARQLGLSEAEIQGITVNPNIEYSMKSYEMLRIWQRIGGFKATYKQLVKECLNVNDAGLAEEICRLLISSTL